MTPDLSIYDLPGEESTPAITPRPRGRPPGTFGPGPVKLHNELPHNADEAFLQPSSPALLLQREQPRHRLICFLKASGLSNIEIAQRLDITPSTVAYTVLQPWAQQLIAEELKKAGRDELHTILEGAAKDALNRLIEEMDNVNARPSERISAADKVLDRFLGKPNQPITHNQGIDLSSLTDAELVKLATGESRN